MRSFTKVLQVIDQTKADDLSQFSRVLVIDKFEQINMKDPFTFKDAKQKKKKEMVISEETLKHMEQNSEQMAKVDESTLVYSKFKYSSKKYYPQS